MTRWPIYLETATRRSFAGAIEWPGWCRSGRSAADAVAALVASGPRYAKVLAATGVAFEAPTDASELLVVEKLTGGSGTDFGAPTQPPAADGRGLDGEEAERQLAILMASWRAFDSAATEATGHDLRTGPRGGGRDLERIVEHVIEADGAYLVQLGARVPRLPGASRDAAWAVLRDRAGATVRARATGSPIADASRARSLWTPRYYARRAAWHLLDHTWEIEDRAI